MGIRGKDLEPRFRRTRQELRALAEVFGYGPGDLVPSLDELLARKLDVERAKLTQENLDTIQTLLHKQYPNDREMHRQFEDLLRLTRDRQEGDQQVAKDAQKMREQLQGAPPQNVDAAIRAEVDKFLQMAQKAGIKTNTRDFQDVLEAFKRREQAKARVADVAWEPMARAGGEPDASAGMIGGWGELTPLTAPDQQAEVAGESPWIPERLSTQILTRCGQIAVRLPDDEMHIMVPSAASAFSAYMESEGGKGLGTEAGEDTADRLHAGWKSDAGTNEWRGGSRQQLVDAFNGDFDQSLFLSKRDQLTSHMKELDQSYTGIESKRVRRMSEHDGEFDYDRKWDRQPFSRGERAPLPIYSVTVKVDFSFSADVESEQITEYGAYAWAVVDFLENRGYRCEIIICTRSIKITKGKIDDRAVCKDVPVRYQELIVKRAGEYIDTMELARCFTSNFYRRVMLAHYALWVDAAGFNVQGSLGSPNSLLHGVQAKPGLITMQADLHKGRKIRIDDLKKAIVASLGIQITEVVPDGY